MKIAFYDTKDYDKIWFEKILPQYGYEMNYLESRLNEKTAVLAEGCEAVCLFVNDILDKKTVEKLYNEGVRAVLMRCAGYDKVDLEACKGKLTVMRVPSYSPTAVAEYNLAMALTINRKMHKAYVRTRDYNFKINGLMGTTMKDKTVGLIGTGKIGKESARLFNGIGMNVICYDMYPDTKSGLNYVTLDEIFEKSDLISLHIPLTEGSKHIINKESIAKMKDGVMLVNTSRGGLIDTKALIEAIEHNKFRGVALDVYEEEGDYFFEDKSDEIIQDDELIKLMSFPNVLVTSHQAFFTEESMQAISKVTLDNLKAFEKGEKSGNEVEAK